MTRRPRSPAVVARRLAALAALVIAADGATAARAAAQNVRARPSILLGAGPADRAGAVGHAGLLVLPSPRQVIGLRADAMAGAVRSDRVGALSVAVEAAPRIAQTGTDDIPLRGIYVFAAGGVAATWYGPSRNTGLMLAVGTRLRLGRITLTGEQRFQQDFSPLLVGLAF